MPQNAALVGSLRFDLKVVGGRIQFNLQIRVNRIVYS